jgi:hypothetical protein
MGPDWRPDIHENIFPIDDVFITPFLNPCCYDIQSSKSSTGIYTVDLQGQSDNSHR